jgi:hypothetical protein
MALGRLTLAEIRQAARQRSDMVNSQFVTDPEFDSYINQSAYELYDLIIQKYGSDYYVASPLVFTIAPNQDTHPLPNDFYKGLGVDLQINNALDRWVRLNRFNFSDRNRFQSAVAQPILGRTNLRYRFRDNVLWFTPVPSAGLTFRLWYIPRLTELVLDTDVLDGVSGWTEYVIIDAAIKALQKEESDVSVLSGQKQAMIARIEAAAENRDAGSPSTVSDTAVMSTEWGNGVGGFWGGW